MCAALNSQSFMSACVMSWMCVLFAYQNIGITHKIQVLHLKSNFITLKSFEGLSALHILMYYSLLHVCQVFQKTNRWRRPEHWRWRGWRQPRQGIWTWRWIFSPKRSRWLPTGHQPTTTGLRHCAWRGTSKVCVCVCVCVWWKWWWWWCVCVFFCCWFCYLRDMWTALCQKVLVKFLLCIRCTLNFKLSEPLCTACCCSHRLTNEEYLLLWYYICIRSLPLMSQDRMLTCSGFVNQWILLWTLNLNAR